MSTYLELVNNVLTRLNENNLDSSNFASARGIHGAAKIGVNNAIMKINSQKWEWPFNYASTTQTMTVGQVLYSFPADFKQADWESFYFEDGTFGSFTIQNQRLYPIQRQEWYKWHRNTDLDQSSAGRELPRRVFWNSNQQFGVTPCPNAAYILNYNYWKKTTALSAHSDSILVPENFNWVIEQGALEDMYMFLDNDQRAAIGKLDFNDGINQMATILIPWNLNGMRDTVVNRGGQTYYSNRFLDTWG